MDKKEILERYRESSHEISCLISTLKRMNYRMIGDYADETRFKLFDAINELEKANKNLAKFADMVCKESESKNEIKKFT